jgi:Mn2+/Fe2+ NRAMP family transporter
MYYDNKQPPKGLGLILVLGPSLIWCAEYIGSGEVILATRTGAVLGVGVLWAIFLGIFLKYWIGLCGARYTVITGEGMVDMFGRMPGPKNWLVKLVFAVQFICAIASIGALATAAAAFAGSLIPLGRYNFLWGWIITIFTVSVTWNGRFEILKKIMSLFVALIVIGVLFIALRTLPPVKDLLSGIFVFKIPQIPAWAGAHLKPEQSAWTEILPLLGWAAGGFASQVWYTYWVLGAGYGMAQHREYGKKADESVLKGMTLKVADNIRAWLRVVNYDATLALVIGTLVTMGFLIAGAGVLGSAQVLPKGNEVAFTLSRIFSEHWGEAGAFLFLLSGTVAMISTQLGQLAGWPRLLADCFRILFPKRAEKIPWVWQFRGFLILFLFTNMIIVYTLGYKPVKLVKMAAVADGLLLTWIQAIALICAFKWVLPKLIPKDVYQRLKPLPIYYIGLIASAVVFALFCIILLPKSF